jgi:ABC-type uncharacterized transport system ATPase subunit
MLSKFKYIQFDELGSNEQNKLRELYIRLESDVKAGKKIPFPRELTYDTEYSQIVQYLRTVWENNIWMRLSVLEILYFIDGRDIWKRVAARKGL